MAGENYAGSGSCEGCHSVEYKQWQGSHHFQAMQVANSSSVAGDFDNKVFEHFGVKHRFFIRAGKYYVNTQDKGGQYRDFPIHYTFGVEPLQQYLLAFPDGRYQALTVAWDNRPVVDGGQHWFHLYPNDPVDAGGALHWTGSYFNWNLRCAECHSTALEKNYSVDTNSYQTTWQEINVACEACHGPAANHVNLATKGPLAGSSDKGFSVDIGRSGIWLASEKNTASLQGEKNGNRELDICAGCHSRRSILQPHSYGQDFLDTNSLSLLSSDLYFSDGQIREEVFVYGSFLQSKMHQEGVVCSNCHNPHSAKVYDDGNTLCTGCHRAEVFDRSEHHHHKINSSGAACKNCHMPETMYMVIDPRRDHSLRIPDPSLSIEFGIPNACNQCHRDKDPQWAMKNTFKWYGPRVEHVYAKTFHQAGLGELDSDRQLSILAMDKNLPAIVRATALNLLQRYGGQMAVVTASQLLYDVESLVRRAAVALIEIVPTNQRFELLGPLLKDSFLSVRVEAARLLAAIPVAALSKKQLLVSDAALKIITDSQTYNLDDPATYMDIGYIQAGRQDFQSAEKAYLRALVLDDKFLPALLTLADIYRARGEDWRVKKVLEDALAVEPAFADAHYAMGLLLVRQKRYEQALDYFSDAVSYRPDSGQFQYVYSVALVSQGKREQAIEVLIKALVYRPENLQLSVALAVQYLEVGNSAAAQNIYAQLSNLAPNNPRVQQLGRKMQEGR